ncbi:MAG: hypothetical protein ACRCYY_05390 [Trueperaceae bacterium]
MNLPSNWLKPIQLRLELHYPQLSTEQLDSYNNVVQKAMQFGWDTVWNTDKSLDLMTDTKAALELFRPQVLQTYPWMTEENLLRLFNQGCYYALK